MSDYNKLRENERTFLSWDRENYIFPKVTKIMGSIYLYMDTE